jgi:DNA-binding XRE family transcriptional regulator
MQKEQKNLNILNLLTEDEKNTEILDIKWQLSKINIKYSKLNEEIKKLKRENKQVITKEIVDINLHIAKKIKERRLELNITQTKLAKELGITFQQLQKYENGKNRISSGLLYCIAHNLKKPIEYFFEDLVKKQDLF